jgi:predicted phosphoadenosine phosphosulfate sulfurtransferase
MSKTYLDMDVLTAARERIRFIFDHYEKIVVSYSGGKDSTVLLELARQEAERRGRKIYALFIDPEAQYAETIRQIEHAILHDPVIIPIWICIPLLWRNAVSVFQPHWRSWDPEERERWVRPVPEHDCVIADTAAFPFYDENYGIDEVVEEIPGWLIQPGENYASLVGIRADESFHRYTAVKGRRKKNYLELGGRKIHWSTIPNEKRPEIVNFYPIFDWHVSDVWRFIHDAGIRYNGIYDLMYLAGVPIIEQRVCQPYGDEQRRGLDQWAKIEPETWAAALERVSGVNYGARYSGDKMLGYHRGVGLPDGHTWKSYTFFLLSTLPDVVRERYMANFAIALEWYAKKRFLGSVAELADDDTPIPNPTEFNIPSWRKLALSIAKNDFWGNTLDIGVTKYPMRDIYESVEADGRVKVRVSVQPYYDLFREQFQVYQARGMDAVHMDFEHPTAKGAVREMIKKRYEDL